jgi:hypothetical protein
MGMPVYITRVKVGSGSGMVLVSLESPAGEISGGEVQNAEASRVVMSESTFAEVAAIFVDTLKKIQLAKTPGYHFNGSGAAGERKPSSENFAPIGVSGRKH